MANTSGETNVPIGEWSTGSLKVYQDEKINAAQMICAAEAKRLNDLHYADIKRIEEALKDIEQSLRIYTSTSQVSQDKFESAVTARFVQVNEFRGSLDDLSKTMQTKSEASQFQENYSKRHDEVVKDISDLRSRLDVGNPIIGNIQQQLAANAGVRQGSEVTMGRIYAAIGAVGAILGIIVLLSNGVF